MNRIAQCIVFALLYLLTIGCGKWEVQIDRETRRVIDTLYAHEVLTLRPAYDSICTASLDSLVTSMRDSILAVRREEIRKLLGK